MSDYILTEDDELIHYGVKGMKWGVRRSLGIKARGAAAYKKLIGVQQGQVNRLERKKASKGLTDRQQRKLDQGKQVVSDWTSKRNQLIKELSQKDIRRGERAIAAYSLLGASSGIAISSAYVRANKQLERERNRG